MNRVNLSFSCELESIYFIFNPTLQKNYFLSIQAQYSTDTV